MRRVLILYCLQSGGPDMAFKKGELVGCLKINLTHCFVLFCLGVLFLFFFFLKSQVPHNCNFGQSQPWRNGPLPVNSTPCPYLTLSLKEHVQGFWPPGSARISFLQHFSKAKRAQRCPPFPMLPTSNTASWRIWEPYVLRDRRQSAGASATGPVHAVL